MISPSRRQLMAGSACALLLGATIGPWLLGSLLIAPVPRVIGSPPADFTATDVRIPSASGSLLHGWLASADTTGPAVVLLHGVRADRRAMLGRARFLRSAGYTVLLVDFQAHGESPGRSITLGALESLDAAAAVSFLRRDAPHRRIGAIGTSLGGAAALLSSTPLPVQALVLEQVYPTIEQAVRNRLRIKLGPFGPPLSLLLTAQLGLRIGVRTSDLRPIDHIASLSVPLLLIVGSTDRHTTLSESRELFTRAPEPKELWVVEGAAHVDLHRFATAEYETRVAAFLRLWLRTAA